MRVDENLDPIGLLGTAFCPAVGVLLTCAHVADGPPGTVAIHDTLTDEIALIENVRLDPDQRGLDLALIDSPLERDLEPLIVVPSEVVRPGTETWTYGYFSTNPTKYEIQAGYFGGRVTTVQTGAETSHGSPDIVLQYPVVEGMSGAPLIVQSGESEGQTRLGGVTGVCYASRAQRVVAQEVTDVVQGSDTRSETLWRVVEFGLAHHINPVAEFLARVGADDLRADVEELKRRAGDGYV